MDEIILGYSFIVIKKEFNTFQIDYISPLKIINS